MRNPDEPPATALGNLEIRFLAPGDPPMVADRLTKLEVYLRRSNLFVSRVYDITGSEGAFRLALSPGAYVVDGLSVKGPGLGKRPIRLPASASFEVPADGCVYVGRMVFSFVSVPPGTLSESEGLAEYIERAGGDPSRGFEWTNMKVGFIAQGPVGVELPPPELRTSGWEECALEQATI